MISGRADVIMVGRNVEDVVVLDEPLRVAGAEEPLREPRDREIGEDRRVNADAKPANIVTDELKMRTLVIRGGNKYLKKRTR